jgi:hypothetical protein
VSLHFDSDPDAAELVTSDIALFWRAVDMASLDSLDKLLQREYLDTGTDALRDFIPQRIKSAEALAEAVQSEKSRYERVRVSSLRIAAFERAIRAPFYALKYLYGDAVFPDVFFVIGRFTSGGTVTENGIIIGAEMYENLKALPHIVAHELVHIQQKAIADQNWTLLSQSVLEGSADFVGELISGWHINQKAHEYGRERESELWQQFKKDMDRQTLAGWLYGDPPDGRPPDLGYFIGYRIVEKYYERQDDKMAAIQDILHAGDARILLAKSGYDA